MVIGLYASSSSRSLTVLLIERLLGAVTSDDDCAGRPRYWIYLIYRSLILESLYVAPAASFLLVVG